MVLKKVGEFEGGENVDEMEVEAGRRGGEVERVILPIGGEEGGKCL